MDDTAARTTLGKGKTLAGAGAGMGPEGHKEGRLKAVLQTRLPAIRSSARNRRLAARRHKQQTTIVRKRNLHIDRPDASAWGGIRSTSRCWPMIRLAGLRFVAATAAVMLRDADSMAAAVASLALIITLTIDFIALVLRSTWPQDNSRIQSPSIDAAAYAAIPIGIATGSWFAGADAAESLEVSVTVASVAAIASVALSLALRVVGAMSGRQLQAVRTNGNAETVSPPRKRSAAGLMTGVLALSLLVLVIVFRARFWDVFEMVFGATVAGFMLGALIVAPIVYLGLRDTVRALDWVLVAGIASVPSWMLLVFVCLLVNHPLQLEDLILLVVPGLFATISVGVTCYARHRGWRVVPRASSS